MGSPLHALFPETRRALLVGFFRQPEQRFYLRQIQRLLAMGRGTVQRELANLLEAGVLRREDEHGRAYYSANPDCPIFPELKSLVDKTAGVSTVLSAALSNVAGVDVAFVFGSMARGEARSDSDVDVAVVGSTSFRAVVTAFADAQLRLGREINPVLFTRGEIKERLARDDPFVREIFAGPKLLLVGDEGDVRAVA